MGVACPAPQVYKCMCNLLRRAAVDALQPAMLCFPSEAWIQDAERAAKKLHRYLKKVGLLASTSNCSSRQLSISRAVIVLRLSRLLPRGPFPDAGGRTHRQVLRQAP